MSIVKQIRKFNVCIVDYANKTERSETSQLCFAANHTEAASDFYKSGCFPGHVVAVKETSNDVWLYFSCNMDELRDWKIINDVNKTT